MSSSPTTSTDPREPADSASFLLGDPGYGELTDQLTAMPLRRRVPWKWLALFALAGSVMMMMLGSIAGLLWWGVGVWGINIPVAWGFAITNFVWWIGIGHAGTLISAILLLLHQQWRNSINRTAEAMTLFAVMMAGLFPLLHLGRPWIFYYILPYPNTMGLWPQWRSPLVWDAFAVATYFTVSLIFWYLGLLPDLATMRDTARRRPVRMIYGVLALGWRGSARHWRHHQTAYLLLAGLATPLVVSVHSIVSLDFTVAIVPGWHSTMFPPYFVAGAIFSGFAMVFTIVIPLRAFAGLHNVITTRHLNAMAKLTLVTGLIVSYGYLMEYFMAFYAGKHVDQYSSLYRAMGAYWPVFFIVIGCNVLSTQTLWFRWVRTSPLALFVLSLVINLGMWTERYMIIVVSLTRDYMPSAWKSYHGTVWDWTLLIGTVGTFTFLMLVFLRLMPSIPIYELREMARKQKKGGGS